jgi:hypothetical protein
MLQGVLNLDNSTVDGDKIINDFGHIQGDGTIEACVCNRGSIRGTSATERLIFTGGLEDGGGIVDWATVDSSYYSPGCSIGVSNLSNVDFTESATIEMEIAGLLPGVEHDVVNVNGNVLIDGSMLDILFVDGFMPSPGQSFDLFNVAGTLGGAFTGVNVLNAGVNVTTSFANGVFQLDVNSVSDFNRDGKVDAADYVVWRNSEGLTGSNLAADGNGDNVIDDLDYGLWRANFGATAGRGSASGADWPHSPVVPEPTALWLLALCVLLSAPARSKSYSREHIRHKFPLNRRTR